MQSWLTRLDDVETTQSPLRRDIETIYEDLPEDVLFCSIWHGPEVHGFTTRPRIGGIFAYGISKVADLRARRETFEGVLTAEGDRIPWVFFEMEKFVRMLLHDSHLAFEILASHRRVPGAASSKNPLPADKILSASVQRGLLNHYIDIAENKHCHLQQSDSNRLSHGRKLVRYLLTARGLVEGKISLNLERLCSHYEDLALVESLRDFEREASQKRKRKLSEESSELLEYLKNETKRLPETATHYDWLNELIVSRRIQSDKHVIES